MFCKNKIIYFLFLIVFLVIPSGDSLAQFTYSCYDTLKQPNPYHPCDVIYEPVCGCDGITYRNPCAAEWHGGLSVYGYENGICGDIDIFLLNNYLTEYIQFAVYLRNSGSVNVAIYDVYGTMYYFDNISNFIEKQEQQIPVQHLRHGVYFLVIFYNGEPVTKKFIRAADY